MHTSVIAAPALETIHFITYGPSHSRTEVSALPREETASRVANRLFEPKAFEHAGCLAQQADIGQLDPNRPHINARYGAVPP
jgi:hypothetical protein